jgi:hypothetical protein
LRDQRGNRPLAVEEMERGGNAIAEVRQPPKVREFRAIIKAS